MSKHQDLIITLAAMAALFGFLYTSLGAIERRIDSVESKVDMLLQAHLPPANHQHPNGD